MIKIKRKPHFRGAYGKFPYARLILAAAAVFFAFPLFAQTGMSLEAEIRNLQRSANLQGIPPTERHAALVRLAQLRQLSGDIEGAARNWLEAAGAVPGSVDDDALLSCAYCLAAMGEWDRASTAVEPLLFKSSRARFLELCIRAIRTGDMTTLVSLAANPEYSQLKSEIYFILWKLTGPNGEIWRRRLAAEFPQSIEGRLAAGESTQAVIVRPSPFWLFMGSVQVTVNSEQRTMNSEQEAGNNVQTAGSRVPVAEAAPAAQTLSQPPASLARLQTGIYGQRSNAQAQADRLRQAGFDPDIEERLTGGSQMWAVTVPVGQDQNRTVRELQNAGFESFLIR